MPQKMTRKDVLQKTSQALSWVRNWLTDMFKAFEYRVFPLLVSTRRRHRYRQANPSFVHLKTLSLALGGTLVVLLSVGMVISQSAQFWVSAEGTLDEPMASKSSTAQLALSADHPAYQAALKRLGTINSVDGLQQKSWENGLALMETLSTADELMTQHGRTESTMHPSSKQSDNNSYHKSLNQQIAVIENLMAERKALLSLAKRHHVNTLYTPMVQSQLQHTLDRLAHNGATLPPQWHQWKTLLSDADESATSPTL